ncbi:hypothetical protein K6U06_14765 [Acidiferrimicrobium sp. IK]|uniref:hypothetical protein n=1 Tax=Acidiferrimicrobium sp. IK TaxID=2871700 RepID=UPI0021CB573A|nr:hypothetical protein [Acidiferrimicrobium sp. IK]MCU4185627.1 hypothetical protein [Acidiferrimicrobium sp. IK]
MREPSDVLDSVRRVRRRLAEAGPSSEREPGDFPRVALPEGDADVFRDLLIAERARVVIEVGLAYGSSALAIGEALLSQAEPWPTQVIIDAYQDHFGDAGCRAVAEAGLTGVARLFRQRSLPVWPRR